MLGYSGGERLSGGDVHVQAATMLDFWRWAYSDLMDNTGRGVFAEWMVTKIIGLPAEEARSTWHPWDISTPEKVRLEVKASAHWQSFHDPADEVADNPSKIRFERLKTKWPLDAFGKRVADTETYNADLYIFCAELCIDRDAWNPLDLRQWQFYVLERETLRSLNQKSMNLNTLRKTAERTGRGSLAAAQLRENVNLLVEKWAAKPEVQRRGDDWWRYPPE